MSAKNYVVERGGLTYKVKLTDEEAKARGLTPAKAESKDTKETKEAK